MLRILLLFSVVLATAECGLADEWRSWRGPRGMGISAEKNLPTAWSATENVVWKAPLPEPGNSTPIISGDHIFLTQALDGGKRRAVMALSRKTGAQLWRREVACDVEETTHRQNPPCSASPVTDGEVVYAHFASAGVVAYDFDGKLLWHRKLGPVLHRWGNGGSPVLYRDTLIVYQGPGEPTFLTALDRRTGKTIWRTDEPGINSPIFGSWGTPLVLRVGDHDELIMPLPGEKIGGTGWFKGYDPASGKELWKCDGLGNEVYAMPITDSRGSLVIGISGHKGPTMAVRPGGHGDVTASHRLWRTESKNPQRVGAGVVHEGHLYLSNATGIMECLEARTGRPVWKERLGGNLWGSVLLADGKLYVSNLEGDTFIVAASPEFKLLAKNSLGEPMYAAPAVSGGRLYLRTYEHLYCIEKPN